MGKLSRTKGANFERKIAARLRKQWPEATVRRTLQAHRAYESDIVVEDALNAPYTQVWWELTDSARPDPMAKMVQAVTDIANADRTATRWPVVVWHKKGASSVHATMSYHTLRSMDPSHGAVIYTRINFLVTLDFEEFLRLIS